MTTARRAALIQAILARGAQGAVTSPHHLASQAGMDILKAGGGAVDAAIATNAALAVVAAHSCGLGGDAFWLIWDPATHAACALDGSGRSGAGASIQAARAAGLDEMPLRGPWTVTVPGAIDSWREAHERFGRLPWTRLFDPAIELGAGFAASQAWVDTIERSAQVYGSHSDWAATFRPLGRAWRPGERVALPKLRRTLQRIAAEGAGTAYGGALAAQSAAYLAANGSPLRAADFAAHRSDWSDPLATTYRGVTSLTHPPASCGAIAMETLNVLSRFDPPEPDAFDGSGVDDARWVHLGLEVSRLTLADRDALLTDRAAMAHGAEARLLSPARADELASQVDLNRATAGLPLTLPRGGGTIALQAASADGMLVSLIESNYGGFGSGLVDPETGISFQNRGAFYRLAPDHANALAPRKRTLHTLTPGMLLRDGRPWIAHGSMGGEIQPQIFAQFVSAVVDGGLDVATAVAAPRWAADPPEHLAPPSVSLLESRYHPDVVERLMELGHDVQLAEPWSSALGYEHAIEVATVAHAGTGPPEARSGPTFSAATDPRSEGLPIAW